MPKCGNNGCNKVQSKLNKGDLCKSCLYKKNNPVVNVAKDIDQNNDDAVYDAENDRTIIDLFKDSMSKEKIFNDEIITLLKDQVEFLKNEITVKNTLIESILCELYKKSNYDDHDSQSVASKVNLSQSVSSIETISNQKVSNINVNNDIPSEIASECVDNNYHYTDNIIHPNKYQVLINDSNSSFDTEFRNAEVIKVYNPPATKLDNTNEKRPNVVINKFPENDNTSFSRPKVVPGNASYSNMTQHGRKVLLLSDSILSRIQMRKLNYDLKTTRAYRKYFPGAKPSEIAHYCLPILQKDKPEVVVIHVGSNSILNDEVQVIANEIFNLVNICITHGVNDIFVSGVTFRKNHITKVRELNNFIDSKQFTYGFKFINNDNIMVQDIGKDTIHLNYNGIMKIANNITDAINTLHTS